MIKIEIIFIFSSSIAIKNLRYLARYLVVALLLRDYTLINEVIEVKIQNFHSIVEITFDYLVYYFVFWLKNNSLSKLLIKFFLFQLFLIMYQNFFAVIWKMIPLKIWFFLLTDDWVQFFHISHLQTFSCMNFLMQALVTKEEALISSFPYSTCLLSGSCQQTFVLSILAIVILLVSTLSRNFKNNLTSLLFCKHKVIKQQMIGLQL